MVLATILLAMVAQPSRAQRFQYTFGGASTTGEEGSAVVESSNGDFIAAGSAASASPNNTPEVYVVRTDANGNLLWHFVYDVHSTRIGAATDIKEYPNGDLAVVGWCGAPFLRSAFAMRITSAGVPIWARLITIQQTPNTRANSVVIMQSPPQPGDIVLAGSTGGQTPGSTKGLLARIDGNGNGVWTRTYDLVNTSASDEMLYGIDETRVLSAAGTIGDIVAVGESFDSPAGVPSDVWVLRVDGTTGTIGASPYGSALYGSPRPDIGYSIQELRSGSHPGDLVVTGGSLGRPAPSTSSEILAMQLLPDPCAPGSPRAARYCGDNAGAPERGLSVREITAPGIGTVGNVMVCGGTRHGVFGNTDGFMQEFREGTMAPVGFFYLYGGLRDEEARSLAQALNAPATPGYVFTGSTTSPDLMPPGNRNNLWLVKNNSSLDNVCHYERLNVSDNIALWSPLCLPPIVTALQPPQQVPPLTNNPTWNGFQVCYTPVKAIAPNAPSGEARVSRLAGYPNPIRRDASMTLTYELSASGMASIAIADLTGRVVYGNSAERDGGVTTELVSTIGWSSGTYVAKVTVNGSSATTRIVVAGR